MPPRNGNYVGLGIMLRWGNAQPPLVVRTGLYKLLRVFYRTATN